MGPRAAALHWAQVWVGEVRVAVQTVSTWLLQVRTRRRVADTIVPALWSKPLSCSVVQPGSSGLIEVFTGLMRPTNGLTEAEPPRYRRLGPANW
jgi:hypothetical protein